MKGKIMADNKNKRTKGVAILAWILVIALLLGTIVPAAVSIFGR